MSVLRWTVLGTFLCGFLPVCSAQSEHQSAPRFVRQPAGGYVMLGQRRGLQCDAVGSPAPEVQLLKDGVPLSNLTTLRLVHVVRRVELSHTGFYQCLAKNAAGALLSDRAWLRVAHLTSKDSVTETVTKHVRRGGSVVLDPPRVDSVPEATSTWLRLDGGHVNGERLEGIKYATTQDNSLVILGAGFEDKGRYQVQLTNPHTGDLLEGPLIELEVEGESSEESPPLSIVVPPLDRDLNNINNGYDATLECVASGSPLEEVVVQWLKEGQPLGTLPHILTHWNRTLALLDVGPQHAGRYTCQVSMHAEPNRTIEAHANVTVSSECPLLYGWKQYVNVQKGGIYA